MKALITGITGFVGSHLAEHLLSEGDEVFGVSRTAQWPPGTAHLADRVQLIAADVADRDRLARLLRDYRPDHLYHLAGQANQPASFRDPQATWSANVDGTWKILEAIRLVSPDVRVLHVSTGHVYGQPADDEMPITERNPLRPLSPYALSKATADLIAYYYVMHYRLAIIVARPFNHIGPRQQSTFAIAHFARQIAEAELGLRPPRIEVGRLDVERDLTDVRDVVRAYRLLLATAQAGEVFNVASGAVRRLNELVNRLNQLSRTPILTCQNPEFLRSNDPPRIEVSVDALTRRTGWRPIVPLDQTLCDTLEYWRMRVGKEGSCG
jgi:GDP-4-dehydro-6-deoxy-D-mannose reductase